MNVLVVLLLSLTAAAEFPSDYVSSRNRFRAACAEGGGTLRTLKVPSPTDADLTIDICALGEGHPRQLIVQSGTHGVEGPAGAAIQIDLLEHAAPKLLAQGIDIVLIHALDPYGFKYHQRTTENNVNLNRGFAIDPATYASVNAGYARWRGVFEPGGMVGPLGSWQVPARVLLAFAKSGGDRQAISDAINRGQYAYPWGLNYGGKLAEPQVELITRELSPRLRAHRSTLFLDVHTGLGDRGVLHVISTRPRPGWIDFLNPADVRFTAVSDPGFYATEGDVTDFVSALAPGVRALTLEFGTLGLSFFKQLSSLSRLILQNQARVHGCASELVRERIADDFQTLFNPKDDDWRRRVLATLRELFTQIAARPSSFF